MNHDYRIKFNRRRATPLRVRVECNCGWHSLWYRVPANRYDMRPYDAHKDHVARARKGEAKSAVAHIALVTLGLLIVALFVFLWSIAP